MTATTTPTTPTPTPTTKSGRKTKKEGGGNLGIEYGGQALQFVEYDEVFQKAGFAVECFVAH